MRAGDYSQEVSSGRESLAAFLKAMGQFDRRFCEAMTEGMAIPRS